MCFVPGRWQLCWGQSPPATDPVAFLGLQALQLTGAWRHWKWEWMEKMWGFVINTEGPALVRWSLLALCMQGMQHSTCCAGTGTDVGSLLRRRLTASLRPQEGTLLSACCLGTVRRWATLQTCSCHATYPQCEAFSSYRLGRCRQPWI